MEINLANTIPLFAHDFAMSTITKEKKSKDGKMKKECFTELVFVDALRKSAIARIILPMTVLEEMPKLIEDNIKKIKKDLNSKTKSKPSKPDKAEVKTASSYLG
ncbi:Uncharacterised protein [uncultured archaeon]|nr:Uncharacterised protein [uncultured archaeon]